ncbi:thioredoxin-dependent thiol peroxidase [Clostridium thermarum]|uniref:thioredoxin-dependent thiol peroxidase n=1 Tax=Clostridium thermarum TaxID=1716543 RepID=UPI0013D7A0E8|nr:thioredoxin-dependent thiol peroxidase [Clostridium thermarum]
MNNIEVIEGQMAPDFSLMGSDNKSHSLSDYRGSNIVLYFYPKDNTPGCTLEAQDFRDNIEKFKELNTVVLGVSRDSLSSHEKFITKQCLPFILLSDDNEEVCNLYGVLKEKTLYGKKHIGIERSTFIIDTDGVLRRAYRKVKVDGHVEHIIEYLCSL